jgi:DNA-binding MarR family transcriptional regulator
LDTRSRAEDVLDRFGDLMERIAGIHASDFLGVDLTMPQAKVLYFVSVRPAAPMSAIASELHVGLSAVSGLVDRLVAQSYVDRREDPRDRRQQLVTITPAGAAALDRMRELRAEMMRQLLAGFTPDELAATEIAITAMDREARRLQEAYTAHAASHERKTA